MKNRRNNSVILIVVGLFALSFVIYGIQIMLFHDERDTWFYLLQDWAFLPVQVALVTIVVGKIINERDRKDRFEKTRMLASSFFSEFGAELLCRMMECVSDEEIRDCVSEIDMSWTDQDFREASERIKRRGVRVRCSLTDLEDFRDILQRNRMSFLVIVSNPMLLEHEEFTDMLWAIFHLNDEFAVRGDLSELSADEMRHLDSDIDRAISELLGNWLCHLNYIKDEYPYLFIVEAKRLAAR